MYSMVTIVNNPILHILKGLGKSILKFFSTGKFCNCVLVLTGLPVEIILQYIQILNQYIVYMKVI